MKRQEKESEESRRSARYETEDLAGRLAYRLDGEVINLGSSGMAIRTYVPLPIGRNHSFRLGDTSVYKDVDGEIAWCKLRATRKTGDGDVLPIYEAGVSFSESHLEEVELLGLLKGKVFVLLGTSPGDEHRVVGRFSTEQEESVGVEVSREFRVRRLSLNGMLVESSASPVLETAMQVQLQLGRAKFISRGRVANVESLEVVDGWQLYGIGIEFVDTKRTQRRKLDRFVRRVVSQRQE